MPNVHPDQFSGFVAQVSEYAPGVHILNAGASREQVLEVEKDLGINLPESYRQFLLYFNGGSLFGDYIVLFATHKRTEASEELTLTSVNKQKWPGMPASFFAIAAYSWGDEICIVLDAQAGDSPVILWDHEIGKMARRWPSLAAWLDYEMKFGSTMYNLDGSWKENRLERAFSSVKKLLGKSSKRTRSRG